LCKKEKIMSQTTFSGPVTSLNGFTSGTSAAPVTTTTAANLSSFYGSTSATSGDTRLVYDKLTFTGAGGAGETLRAFSVVSGVGAAAGGTINGAHISASINGSGTIAGAANALRATLGGTSTNPGGTLAAIQADSDFATGGTWTNSSFIRFTNSGTGVIPNLFNVPAAMVVASVVAASSHTIKIVDSAGTAYYLLASTTAP
jgi:hypothetical protein